MKIFIISLTLFLMSSFTSNATTSNGEKKICSGFAKWTKEGEFKTIRSKCITEKRISSQIKIKRLSLHILSKINLERVRKRVWKKTI